MAEPKPEPTPEGKPEGGGDGTGEYQWLDGAPPAIGEEILDKFDTGIVTGVIMPTVAVFVFLVSGLMIHSMLNQKRWWRKFISQIKYTICHCKTGRRETFMVQGDELLLTPADCLVVEAYSKFPNRPSDLMKLLFPALISLTGSPTLLMLKNYINAGFFPGRKFQPNTNDVLQCFLIPAGLLYATVFGFSLEICVWRFHGLSELIDDHYKGLRNAMMSVVHDRHMTPERKVKLMRKLKDEIIILMQVFMKKWDFQTRGIQDSKPIDLTQGVYSFMLEIGDFHIDESEIYDVLENQNHDEARRYSGKVLDTEPHLNPAEKMVYADYMSMVIDCRWKIIVQSETASMNIVQWFFLEFLAYTSYFGILMLVASSALLELVMCTVTVTSISMFSYILSDISSPLHGFFRISASAHMDLLRRMQLMASSDVSTWGDLMDPTTFTWQKDKAATEMLDQEIVFSDQQLIKNKRRLSKLHST